MNFPGYCRYKVQSILPDAGTANATVQHLTAQIYSKHNNQGNKGNSVKVTQSKKNVFNVFDLHYRHRATEKST